jgi:CelD/BcsL family acetyltransferase involved in cellulose biosynthesis
MSQDIMVKVNNLRQKHKHTLLGDTSVRVDLLEDLVDVRRVRFGTLLGLLASGGLLRGLGGLLGWGLGHSCELVGIIDQTSL